MSGTPLCLPGCKERQGSAFIPHLLSDLCSPRCTLGFKSRDVDALLGLADGTTAEGQFPSLLESTLLASLWGQGGAGVSVWSLASLKGNMLLHESVLNSLGGTSDMRRWD